MGFLFLVIVFISVGFLAFLGGIVYLLINLIRRRKKKIPLIVISASIVLFILGVFISPKANDSVNASNKKINAVNAAAKKLEEQKKDRKKQQELLNFKGNLNAEVKNGKVLVSIDSNVPDGGIFEVTLMNGKIDIIDEFIKTKDGKIRKEFTIPKKWGVGYIATSAMFRFNYDKKPQPESIKKIYGNKGEKLTGKLVNKNKTGNSAILKTKTVAYPNKTAVADQQNKNFNKTIDALIKTGSGVILSIQPRYDNKWDMVNVVVSDSWYYSAEYEKERFAEQVGETVQKIVINSGKAKDPVMVYFVDSFNKDVATPKMFGGWKIKKS
ncbi:O-antigen ligase family protein [Bacillus sp. FJAT-49736]|uniref:O-antigen ligase family protein n=1 Tax=Bacillus sp. FJAT-49736 TaxID=2833582 RepID=UPI001BC9EA50|nr:O-antigen ligase family protein [Bacillus sp. FJAT-49736]MBS4172077.1 O-antigen ligase family protein [Bacillus sp. FJAT-49736]